MEAMGDIVKEVIRMLKTACKAGDRAAKLECINYMFTLLKRFAAIKNKNAPFVYKCLTFSMIEHFEDEDIRMFFYSNFKGIPGIPIRIFLEPLIKKFAEQEPEQGAYKNFDFHFFKECVWHPKFDLTIAIMMFDCLAKVYSTD